MQLAKLANPKYPRLVENGLGFRQETGHSPAKAVEQMRLDAARLLLEGGTDPIEEIAGRAGFGDRNACAGHFAATKELPHRSFAARPGASISDPPLSRRVPGRPIFRARSR